MCNTGTHTPTKWQQKLWKKRTNTAFSPRLILQLSLCWSQARLFVTVFPVHLLSPAYTWQIQQHGTLINRNTGFAQPKKRCICGNGLNMWWWCFPRQQKWTLPNHSVRRAILHPAGRVGGSSRRCVTSSYTKRWLMVFISRRFAVTLCRDDQ